MVETELTPALVDSTTVVDEVGSSVNDSVTFTEEAVFDDVDLVSGVDKNNSFDKDNSVGIKLTLVPDRELANVDFILLVVVVTLIVVVVNVLQKFRSCRASKAFLLDNDCDLHSNFIFIPDSINESSL